MKIDTILWRRPASQQLGCCCGCSVIPPPVVSEHQSLNCCFCCSRKRKFLMWFCFLSSVSWLVGVIPKKKERKKWMPPPAKNNNQKLKNRHSKLSVSTWQLQSSELWGSSWVGFFSARILKSFAEISHPRDENQKLTTATTQPPKDLQQQP